MILQFYIYNVVLKDTHTVVCQETDTHGKFSYDYYEYSGIIFDILDSKVFDKYGGIFDIQQKNSKITFCAYSKIPDSCSLCAFVKFVFGYTLVWLPEDGSFSM